MRKEDLIEEVEILRKLARNLNINPTSQDLADAIVEIGRAPFPVAVAYTAKQLSDALGYCQSPDAGRPFMVLAFENRASSLLAQLAPILATEVLASRYAPAPAPR